MMILCIMTLIINVVIDKKICFFLKKYVFPFVNIFEIHKTIFVSVCKTFEITFFFFKN